MEALNLIEDMTALVSALFNLGFKHCKYCNKLFYPQHNRQVHCCEQHRKWYKQERYIEKRSKERRKSVISYIDPHGNFITLKAKHHLELGSNRTRLNQHRLKDPVEEYKKIRREFQMLGLTMKS
jgi:hypothetical protein